MKIARDFILPKKDPSLVLYLPLYKLDGASFMSKDAYGHLCTATGALWTPRGRDFDGVDDCVGCGNPVSLQITGGISILSWCKPDTIVGNDTIATKFDAAGNQRAYTFYLSAGVVTWTLSSTLTPFTGAIRSSKTTLTAGRWYFLAGTFVPAVSQDVYLNGQLDNGALSGTIPTGIANSPRNLAIGGGYNNSTTPNADWFDGLIGVVLILRRAFTALEILNYYLATKWRYQ